MKILTIIKLDRKFIIKRLFSVINSAYREISLIFSIVYSKTIQAMTYKNYTTES